MILVDNKVKSTVWPILLIPLLASCTPQRDWVHLTDRTMGTTYNIKYLAISGNSSTPSRVKSQVTRLLDEINQKLSTWRADSEISLFNAHPPNVWFQGVSDELHTVTAYALKIAKKTSGIFDPTLGPLTNLWGFGPNGKKKIPSPGEISRAKARTGHQKLHIRPNALKKSVPGMYLDLSASAKGYAVDRVVKMLEQMNVTIYMVEIGGEVRVRGGGERPFWKIGIEVPAPHNPDRKIQKILPLSSHALATSGNYRNFFTVRSRIHSHIIDSRSGRARETPIGRSVSVTVLDENSCMNADAWATALAAMGWEKGFDFAKRNRLAAHFIARVPDGSWESRTTDALEEMLNP